MRSNRGSVSVSGTAPCAMLLKRRANTAIAAACRREGSTFRNCTGELFTSVGRSATRFATAIGGAAFQGGVLTLPGTGARPWKAAPCRHVPLAFRPQIGYNPSVQTIGDQFSALTALQTVAV